MPGAKEDGHCLEEDVSAVGQQGVMNIGGQPPLPFLLSPGPQPVEWRHPQLNLILPPPLT